MYPILCTGGYGVPLKAGKCEIIQITAAASDSVAAARLTIVDDRDLTKEDRYGNLLEAKENQHSLVFDKKRVAACDANIDWHPAEPLRVRHGLSVVNAENLVPGSIMVYIR